MKTIKNLGNKRTEVEFISFDDLKKWFHTKRNNELYANFRFRNTYHVNDVDDNFIYIHVVDTDAKKAVRISYSEFKKAEQIFIR